MAEHYDAVMEAVASVLNEAQLAKVREALPLEEYKRLHYSAGKLANKNGGK